jgi:hypothetical protein
MQADKARKALLRLPVRTPRRLAGFNKLQGYVASTKARETTEWLHTVNRHELTGRSKKEFRKELGFQDIQDDEGSARFVDRRELEVVVEIKDFARHGMELSYLEGLSDIEFTAMSQVPKKDAVVTRWEVTGMHTGPILGIAPTGKSVTITGMTMMRFAEEPRPQGGRRAFATDEWTYWDLPGLIEQVGAGR